MSAVLVTAEVLARELKVSAPAVFQAKKSGRLTVIETPDGPRFDLAVARIQWEANRQRRRSAPPPQDGQAAPGSGAEAADGGAYWDAKTRREAAEAAMAELKLAELSKSLVQRAAVDRVLFGAARVMRDQMLALAPRLAATVAPLSDPKTIELKIADEVRVALRAFAQQLRAGGMVDVSDGLDR